MAWVTIPMVTADADALPDFTDHDPAVYEKWRGSGIWVPVLSLFCSRLQ